MLTLRIGMIWNDAGIAFAQTAPAAKSDGANDKPAKAPAPADPSAAADNVATKTSSDKAKEVPQHFTAGEVEVLQSLSKRRVEIEQRGEELDKREILLKAAEQRVDEKITRLQQFQQKLDAAIGQARQEDDARIQDLVKVYETMKPKEAAAIFEGMETQSLLPILGKMKDQKTASILAAMLPEKARAITLALAQRRELPDMKTN